MKKQKDGRYRTTIVIGHDENGDPIKKYPSGRTKRELNEAIEELKKKYITGNAGELREVLCKVYIKDWYERIKQDNLSIATQKDYESALRAHIYPAIGDMKMRAVTMDDLQRLMDKFKGKGKSSIGQVYTILSAAFARAHSQGVIDRDPVLGVVLPTHTVKRRRALLPAESTAFLQVSAQHPDGIILSILFYTGLRIGEALALQWGDVDFKLRRIHVSKDVDYKAGGIGEVKTDYSVRDVPISQELYNILSARRGLPGAYVISAPKSGYLSKATYERKWASLMHAMYEIDPTIEAEDLASKLRRHKSVKPEPYMGSILTAHYFRHNYAAILYNAGVDVLSAQKWLGHAKASTTMNVYAKLSRETERQSVLKIDIDFTEIARQM